MNGENVFGWMKAITALLVAVLIGFVIYKLWRWIKAFGEIIKHPIASTNAGINSVFGVTPASEDARIRAIIESQIGDSASDYANAIATGNPSVLSQTGGSSIVTTGNNTNYQTPLII